MIYIVIFKLKTISRFFKAVVIRNKNTINPIIIFISAIYLLFSSIGSMNKDDTGKQKHPIEVKAIDTCLIAINKLHIPLNNRGVIANLYAGGISQGEYDSIGFLFSGGFMMSGKNNGSIWSNAVSTSSRIEDYLPGIVDADPNDIRARLYIINSNDTVFGQSWQEWKDAVDLGAYFYDGDGDKIYNPVDKNGNGEWDQDEDMPDILGDETDWCVYNDRLDASVRSLAGQEPMGIEIRQTVWGYNTSGDLGNVVFIRYSINNAGTVSDLFDSVYFGIWDDADLGDSQGYTDDLVGCDIQMNAGFTYNDGPDPKFGIKAPCFLVDMIQGPWISTGNPNNLAFNDKGAFLGIDTIKGAINLSLTSFVQLILGHPSQDDPESAQQLRNFLLGKNQVGAIINPCDWEYGTVLGSVECSAINGKFMYSGDPVMSKGWVNNFPTDQRQMLNTGPFILEKDKPIDIIVAYIVGRGEDELNSITIAKQIDSTAKIDFPTDVKPIPKQIPIEFELSQNYPNPFNPTTNIRFRIAASGVITIKVYDVLGREVAILVNEEKLAGEYEVEFDSGNLSSGVYFYTIRVDPFFQTKKMILLR